jgi:hypothetical protein
MPETPREFDFLEGEWQLVCRYPRTDGSWGEGPGSLKVTRICDGRAFLELFEGPYVGGEVIKGAGFRAFNPRSQCWEHTWTDSGSPGGFPVWRGRWEDGHIHIFSEWTGDDGRTVRSRLTWSQVTDRSAHWESHRSLDGGKSWEKHWVIDLRKLSAPSPAP